MNCLEFQRELNADPKRLSPVAQRHGEDCPDCARRLVRQLHQEACLRDALKMTGVPEGLEDRILLATHIGQRQRLRLAAVAAVSLLAASLTLSWPLLRPASPASIAVAHVVGEPKHLADTLPVSLRQLDQLFALVGAHPSGSLPATFANACDMPKGKGGHVVFDTPHGRVTVILMPAYRAYTAAPEMRDGMLVQVFAARHGSYALVAPNAAALDTARALLHKNLHWT